MFLGMDKGGKGGDDPVVCGTAFFVAWPAEDADEAAAGRGHSYLVTAKHVVDGILAKSSDQRIYLRVNLLPTVGKGGAVWVSTQRDHWRFPPEDADEYVDVAVLPYRPDAGTVDYRAVHRSMFATQQLIDSEGIGLGDDLFITGLFVNHYGRQRNSPIVRIGNIAGMPDEPVRTNLGRMAAYLVEARSLGGLSGSPAFVSLGPLRTGSGGVQLGTSTRFFLLGLMRGHWDADLEGAEDVAIDSHLGQELVNMGVAIVIPAEKIEAVISQRELKEEREHAEGNWRRQTIPTEEDALSAAAEVHPEA
ncbi:MAG: hypothetical protein WB807_01330 [Candidatus Dormiibacterota bacterium]